ncbi:protein-glutamate O-methyltransferase family protein [Streptacidiphilus sp. PB12-B1b]|uniref:damage-control phosphatase ARMT1 family protein n=1 Tax=Streptacidiphilus sp. PB12-B1b TaxID=2705012 RepID=UPI0015F92599|nr:damage-control phosphatase ARMT1 family protein [Streptacidiphilus sp. PB12-B1b]QMU79585.1 protein-glutamate O-methyltransferase family protein [Streptacidiphilus sp. PB12-B1b]
MTTAPVIGIGVPGTFAWGVFHERHPKLVQQVLDALPYGPAQRAAVGELLAESTGGVLQPLDKTAHDHQQWLDWGGDLFGRPWGEAPFLWAESYFYRRLLEATGYFRPGAWHGIDPFAPFKNAELAGQTVDEEMAALDDLPSLSAEKRAEVLLSSALWGNRADLSFQVTASSAEARTSTVIANDSSPLWSALAAAERARVCVMADNAGRELLPDLVLVDHLLTSSQAAEVVLYVKPFPSYVSDATTADVLATVERLHAAPGREAARIGGRLREAMSRGTLAVRTHPFLCAPLPFRDMPADLRADLSGATMTILKGDLNYRRLVEDRLWGATTSFAGRVAYFPSPVAALRTLKSDVIVGLDGQVVAGLDATGEPWRTSGTYGLIQVCA